MNSHLIAGFKVHQRFLKRTYVRDEKRIVPKNKIIYINQLYENVFLVEFVLDCNRKKQPKYLVASEGTQTESVECNARGLLKNYKKITSDIIFISYDLKVLNHPEC